jgi:hypothetical protein
MIIIFVSYVLKRLLFLIIIVVALVDHYFLTSRTSKSRVMIKSSSRRSPLTLPLPYLTGTGTWYGTWLFLQKNVASCDCDAFHFHYRAATCRQKVLDDS